MNLTDIVMGQGKGMFADQGVGYPVLELAAAVADFCGVRSSLVWPKPTATRLTWLKAKSEIVAGHMVEYSGMSFAMFFLAEYANMWLISILATVMFLGGWLPPIDSALDLDSRLDLAWA